MANKKSKSKQATADATPNGSTNSTPQSPTAESPMVEKVASTSRVSPEPEKKEEGEDPEAIKELGNVAFKAGKYREAIQHYTRAIGVKPTEPSYYTNRAASYIGLKSFKSALDDCQYAITLTPKPTPVKVLLRLARCQAALGNNMAALTTISSVLEVELKNAQALQMKKKIEELEGHLQNFESARKKHDWGMARLALDRCLSSVEAEESEKPLEWRLWRIELEMGRGNLDAASIAANEALRQDPNSPEVLCLRGLVLFLTGKLPQALTHSQSALRLDSGFKAAQDLRKRVKEVTRLKDEGNELFKAGKHKEAVEKYTEALEQIGEKEEEGKGGQIRATLLSNRATTLLKLEKYPEALEDTNVSLELTPGAFKALRTRARLNVHLENYEAAVADFKSAIEQAQMEGSDAEVKSLRTELKKAEADLKRSKTKDYYKILGLARDCSDADIKKAYRKESLKHHPDKGGDEEKFKLTSEAYAVLSDPERRRRYDLGEDEDGMSGAPGFGGGGMGGMTQEDIAEIFAQFHGGGFSFGGGGHNHGFGGGARRGGASFRGGFGF